LPGRQRRRLVGVGHARAALPGQGINCVDCDLFRVFCAKVRTLLLRNLSKFYYKSVQSLRKFLEIRRKFRKKPNNFVWFRERNPTTFVILTLPDSKYL
jgi:hypothetical protein